jgi:signal transduction histidine kinase
MTEANTIAGQNKLTMLTHVIELVAKPNDSNAAITQILQYAQQTANAQGAVFIIFDEPHLLIKVGDSEAWTGQEDLLKSIIEPLSSGLHSNITFPLNFKPKFAGSTVAPLIDEKKFGAVCLSNNIQHTLSDDETETLLPLIHALTIIGKKLQTREIHERSHQLTLSLLSSITDPLLVVDDDRRILLMNPAAETVFKTTSSKSEGKNLREIVQSEELAELAENGTTVNEWVTSDDKTYIPRIEAVRDTSGSIEGWVLALRDVTHFKKLNRNQSEFMRIVSHDLRSPLTSMQGFASMLELGLVGELNEKQKHFVSKILAGITQMTALVDNIQDAGRYDPETGFYDLSRSQVDLGEMVQRIVDNHLVPAEKALSISVAVSDDVPIINADANMLERAIINLFDNAIKYTPDGGKIEVGVKRSENDVLIGVKDSGLGISKDAQHHLFERHVRIAREEHKKIKGSGLGLFIVRSVAQRHGGDAWVESKEGEGSTFFVGIPLEGPNLITSGKN